jgi:hypothetical protein
MCALTEGFWLGLEKTLSCHGPKERCHPTIEESRGERVSGLRDDQPVTDLDLCQAKN